MNFKFTFTAAALAMVGIGAMGCTNQDGAGGTVDGTSEQAYDLRTNQDNLAPPMDSVKAAAPAPAAAKDSTGTAAQLPK